VEVDETVRVVDYFRGVDLLMSSLVEIVDDFFIVWHSKSDSTQAPCARGRRGLVAALGVNVENGEDAAHVVFAILVVVIKPGLRVEAQSNGNGGFSYL
jgi:hypothetical protein